MDFATVAGPTAESSFEWTAAMGKGYVWTMGKAKDLEQCCRMANRQAEVTKRWGIRTALHDHLGSPVESKGELEEFLKRCPDVGLVLDTAHLAAADGDPCAVLRRYPDRLVSIHLKDWLVTNPEIGIKDGWTRRGRFCELGAGNIGLDNAAVLRELRAVGYDGWILVEHDTHLRDPRLDLAVSRSGGRARQLSAAPERRPALAHRLTHYPAVLHVDAPPAVGGHGLVVRDYDERDPGVMHLHEQLEDLPPRAGREIARGLVGQHQ